MAALLVSLTIAAVMMTVVMPVWKQMARREKEEELIFRGLQYARAIRLFGMKYANASPPTLDVLVEQRFIRKKYKDPITNDDFQPVLAGQPVPGTTTPPPNQGRGQSPFSTSLSNPSNPSTTQGTSPLAPSQPGTSPLAPSQPGTNPLAPSQPGTSGRGFSPIGTPGGGSTGGVIGVVSKSKDTSLRLYNGRNHYNEWAFISTPQVQAPGVGTGGRGGRGGPGTNNPNSPNNPNNPFGNPGPFGPGRGTPSPGGPPSGPGRGTQPTSPFGPARPIQVPRPQ
jgi:type II secretory pathway pseudopilin PulG